MNNEEEVCFCGMLMKDHNASFGCGHARAIHEWMEPLVNEFGLHPEVVRIMGREGIQEDVLDAFRRIKDGKLEEGI
jgi:hypothetical protein